MPQDSMRTSTLHIKSDQMRRRMDANQTHTGAWICDEASQTAAPLFHATALRTYKLDTTRYARPNEFRGKISWRGMCGDHLQLPPVPQSSGLLAPMENKSDEHTSGSCSSQSGVRLAVTHDNAGKQRR